MTSNDVPPCVALMRDGAPCGGACRRDDGQYRTTDGRDLWICRACRARALHEALVEARPDRKLKRNDPCPCASGRKFKKCHGANR